MRNKNESPASFWLVWLIIIAVLAVVLVFGYTALKENRKKKQVEEEINKLKEQAKKIEKENINLDERIAYLSSRDYQETQAKDKLNLQNPNENVIIITEGPVKKEEEPAVSDEKNQPDLKNEDIPNYKKWLSYFFN